MRRKRSERRRTAKSRLLGTFTGKTISNAARTARFVTMVHFEALRERTRFLFRPPDKSNRLFFPPHSGSDVYSQPTQSWQHASEAQNRRIEISPHLGGPLAGFPGCLLDFALLTSWPRRIQPNRRAFNVRLSGGGSPWAPSPPVRPSNLASPALDPPRRPRQIPPLQPHLRGANRRARRLRRSGHAVNGGSATSCIQVRVPCLEILAKRVAKL